MSYWRSLAHRGCAVRLSASPRPAADDLLTPSVSSVVPSRTERALDDWTNGGGASAQGSARRAAPIGALLSRVGQGLNHKEIGSPDGLGVVGKEGTPALAGRPGWPTASVTANGACADGDAELEQLTADALGAPVRVLARHGGDQGPTSEFKRGRPRERPDRQRQISASPGDAIAARSQAGPRRCRLAGSGGGGGRRARRACPEPEGVDDAGSGERPGAADGAAGFR